MFGAYGSELNLPAGTLKSSSLVRGLLDRGAEKNAQNFSGGEKQAIAFLRAISKGSDILIMDEPFSAVDQAEREAIESEILQGSAFKDKTVLMITHDVSKRNLTRYDEVIRIENGARQDEIFEQLQGAIS